MNISINIERLKSHIEELDAVGRDPEGGTSRLAYSKDYYAGLDLVRRWMQDAGLTVEMDPVGSMFGRKAGKTDDIIMIGSHTDTVAHGGPFDGVLGVLGGIEVMHSLKEQGIELDHTVIVANWAEEEGNVVKGLIGSGSFVGAMQKEVPVLKEKLAAVNISPEDVEKAKCSYLDKIKAYLELHIEQGGVLDTEKTDIGVVSSIVGLKRFLVTIKGVANHAGTTPMNLRDDALIKAAKLILELEAKCREIDDTMVCTVGWVKTAPGEQNIIPGTVVMPVEIRAVNMASVDKLAAYLEERLTQYSGEMKLTMVELPTKMSQSCMDKIKASADELGLSSRVMPSGAGHDCMIIAPTIPNSGMIFAPSLKGLSHCPQEWTEWKDVKNSTEVLMGTLIKLDKDSSFY